MGTEATPGPPSQVTDLAWKETQNALARRDESERRSLPKYAQINGGTIRMQASNVEPNDKYTGTGSSQVQIGNVTINKTGNWGNQDAPGFYVDGPLKDANGKPDDKEGVTIPKLKDLTYYDDGQLRPQCSSTRTSEPVTAAMRSTGENKKILTVSNKCWATYLTNYPELPRARRHLWTLERLRRAFYMMHSKTQNKLYSFRIPNGGNITMRIYFINILN